MKITKRKTLRTGKTFHIHGSGKLIQLKMFITKKIKKNVSSLKAVDRSKVITKILMVFHRNRKNLKFTWKHKRV